MEWSDRAIVLSARPHGEGAAVATLLTRERGRHAGLVQGARTARQRGVLETGNAVAARWRARLPEHLGTYALELDRSVAAGLLDDPLRLAALVSACALTEAALPEREPHPAAFEGLSALLENLDSPFWDAIYVRWELGLLQELGFGLDLSCCAATGRNDALAYVSPRTGRAVSLSAGEAYRDRLLPLPGFLVGDGEADPDSVLRGLELAGHFLERLALSAGDAGMPSARTRFVERYRKLTARSGKTLV
ncbi:DNA repair protein RecO [Arenibaculum pallidiluteum]|uniref:DNA repair protein RecO n=1 Tax=Arenibaculum pallidiluteum TaxID=2812559 RepID=UPI001A95AA4A|nr:DNA repair protein RecO [Arenibaculum pallidiluteum]